MEKLVSNETINRLGKMIEGLTLEELHTLNRLVVHRVKLFHKVGKFVALSRFSVGETVHFHSHDGRHITGVIERLNQKKLLYLPQMVANGRYRRNCLRRVNSGCRISSLKENGLINKIISDK